MHLGMICGIPNYGLVGTMHTSAKDCFGEAVSFLIRKKGVTQKEVAEALGVTQASVSKWVRKKDIPRDNTLDKLAKYLGVHVAMLFLPPSAIYNPENKKVLFDVIQLASDLHDKKKK